MRHPLDGSPQLCWQSAARWLPCNFVAIPARAPQSALGFFTGVRALFGGLGFVVGTPSVWGWAMIPVVIATALFGGAGAAALYEANVLAERILAGSEPGAWSSIGTWLLRVVFALVGLVISFLVAMSVAQPLSGFALDAVVRRQEKALGASSAWPDQPFVASAARSLRVSLTALLAGLVVIGPLSVVTFVFPPAAVVTIPLKFLVTGLLVAYDLLDYPLSLRGHSVRDRLGFIRKNFSAVLGLGVAAAGLLLIPGIGLLLLPIGVAAATRLVVAGGAVKG